MHETKYLYESRCGISCVGEMLYECGRVCTRVNVYITHTHTHTHAHTHTHTHTHKHTHTCRAVTSTHVAHTHTMTHTPFSGYMQHMTHTHTHLHTRAHTHTHTLFYSKMNSLSNYPIALLNQICCGDSLFDS